MEKEDYIKKWLEGTLDPEEKAIFEGTEEYRSLKKLSDSLMAFQAPEYDVDAEYANLRSRRPVRKGNVVSMNLLRPFLSAAAVLIAVAGIYFFYLHDAPTVINTLAGEKKELTLPDASFVALNAVSRLSFHENKWKAKRRVELEGEAYFQVAKGSRFDVSTSSGTISVLGTAFNVINRTDYFEVICYEGSVKVETVEETVKLSPKQMFQMINGEGTKDDRIATDTVPDWRLGESTFESVPFRHVLQEFERQYDVTVSTVNVDSGKLFTGTFTHADVALALRSISLPFNLTYEVQGKKIILVGDSK